MMNDLANNLNGQIPQHYLDRRPMPQRAEAADGSFLDISGDERLPALYRAYLDDACDHPATVIVQRTNSAGGKFYSRYCSHCGVKHRGHLPHRDAEREGVAIDLTEGMMEARATAYLDQRQAHFDRIVDAAAQRALEAKLHQQGERREAYEDYLRSPQWKRKAAKIMERAGNTCEGCLSRPAEEVHHLTYDHIFAEFAFELVALCAPCHRRFHEKDAA